MVGPRHVLICAAHTVSVLWPLHVYEVCKVLPVADGCMQLLAQGIVDTTVLPSRIARKILENHYYSHVLHE